MASESARKWVEEQKMVGKQKPPKMTMEEAQKRLERRKKTTSEARGQTP